MSCEKEPQQIDLFEEVTPRVGLFIPTLNASRHLDRLLPALKAQSLEWDRFLVIDSASTDDTVERLEAAGAEVLTISRAEFNHGGTRRAAIDYLDDVDIVIMITQDAIPAHPHTFTRLIGALDKPQIGMAYGRQLPRENARGIERHARLFNYPDQRALRRLQDRKRHGIKTVFCSNSCAAYRREALMEIGNFPRDAIFAEDQIVSGRMIMRGWSVAYREDAPVIHSHDYSIGQEFQRYFDVGTFHARHAWLLDAFGKAEGEGMRFLRSELGYLWQHERGSIPEAMIRTVAKYVGYMLGRKEKLFSNEIKAHLSMASFYWRRRAAARRALPRGL